MPKLETPPGALGNLVEDLRKLDDEELLRIWRRNRAALAQPGRIGIPLSARPMLSHYALRFVAIERFGVPEHIARLRDAAGRRTGLPAALDALQVLAFLASTSGSSIGNACFRARAG